MVVAHADRHLHETDAIEILHMDRVRVISVLRVITAHEQEIGETERGGTEQVGLQRDAVPVTSGDLDDGLHAGFADQQRIRDGGHRHDAAVAVGDVDGVDGAREDAGPPFHRRRRCALGRVELRGHDELALPEERCQVAQMKNDLSISREVALAGRPSLIFP